MTFCLCGFINDLWVSHLLDLAWPRFSQKRLKSFVLDWNFHILLEHTSEIASNFRGCTISVIQTDNSLTSEAWQVLIFSIVFPAPWLAEVESSLKSNGMWLFRHFFAPYLFDRSRNNRRDKLRSKFWREKMFGKPHLKLLRWCSVRGINKVYNICNDKCK